MALWELLSNAELQCVLCVCGQLWSLSVSACTQTVQVCVFVQVHFLTDVHPLSSRRTVLLSHWHPESFIFTGRFPAFSALAASGLQSQANCMKCQGFVLGHRSVLIKLLVIKKLNKLNNERNDDVDPEQKVSFFLRLSALPSSCPAHRFFSPSIWVSLLAIMASTALLLLALSCFPSLTGKRTCDA